MCRGGVGQGTGVAGEGGGKVIRDEVSKLWGQGLIISATDMVIMEDVDLPAGDDSFCPGAYLICP